MEYIIFKLNSSLVLLGVDSCWGRENYSFSEVDTNRFSMLHWKVAHTNSSISYISIHLSLVWLSHVLLIPKVIAKCCWDLFYSSLVLLSPFISSSLLSLLSFLSLPSITFFSVPDLQGPCGSPSQDRTVIQLSDCKGLLLNFKHFPIFTFPL